jgi:ParB-like chromosome segregation protein Spo0J
VHIESIPIESINPAAYNPRVDLQPGDPDYARLQRSMDEFGFVEPLVWNRRTGNLVGGAGGTYFPARAAI